MLALLTILCFIGSLNIFQMNMREKKIEKDKKIFSSILLQIEKKQGGTELCI